MPPPTFGTRTVPENNASNSGSNPVPIPKPVQSLLKELTPRLRTLLLTPSQDLSPCLVTINHLLAEPSLQPVASTSGISKGTNSDPQKDTLVSSSQKEGGKDGGLDGSGGSSSKEQTTLANLTSQISFKIHNELMKIFQNEMDQSDLNKSTFLITILRQLSGLLNPSYIVTEWWDLLLRPILKNPLTSSSSAARARQLVVISMARTPKEMYKEEENPVASWPNSMLLNHLGRKEGREKGEAPYPSSSTEPIRSKTSQSSGGSSNAGLTSTIRRGGITGSSAQAQKLNMFFRFSQRIFDLYLSEAVFSSSATRNQDDDDVMDLKEEQELMIEQSLHESRIEEEINFKEAKKPSSTSSTFVNSGAKGTFPGGTMPFKEDDSGPMDLVGTTWKGNLEAILLTYGQEKPTEFFHHLADSFSEPSSRVPLLLLLTIFLRLYSNHAYKITSTRLPKLLVLSLQLDTSKTLISLNLTALVILLPHIPNWVASGGAGGLPILLAIFARVVDWRRLGRGWEDRIGDGDELDNQRRELDEDFGEMDRLGRRLNIRKDLEWKRLAGRTDGLVNIWDIETKGILRWLEGHVKAITDVSWSRYSRYLASSSLDWNVIIWDLGKKPVTRERTIRFDAPVRSVSFHPTNSKILAVVLESQQLYLIDLRKRKRVLIRKSSSRDQSESSHQATLEARANAEGVTEQQERKEKTRGPRRYLLKADPYFNRTQEAEAEETKDFKALTAAIGGMACCKFSPDGSLIFAGTTKGTILVFDVHSRKVINQVKPQGATGMREMAFDRSDRTIRILSVEVLRRSSGQSGQTVGVNIETLHRFQDLVNRTPWLGLGFSGDGEYVFGGASHIAAHNIYIWDRGAGALDKILEGPREPLIDVDWHPSRPLLASVSTSGNINIWFTPTKEIWSAYAPGFEELEENVEYEEREDEFDLEDEEELARRAQDEEEAPVDIWSLGPTGGTTLPSHLRSQEPASSHVDTADHGVVKHTRPAEKAYDGDVKMKGVTDPEETEKWIWEWRYESDEDDRPSFVIHPRLEEEIPELNSDEER